MSAPITKIRHDFLPASTMPLGFGCSGLMHGLNRRESLRLVETAIDCGITYFDTARMYGFGNSEHVLGELARSCRDRIVIASKAGILPANRSLPLRAFNKGVRLLHKTAPPLKDFLAPLPENAPQTGIFDLPRIRKSVETSLKELRTEYLDLLLLHECTAADLTNEELLSFLRILKNQGKIRAFGLATGINETLQILAARPNLASVVQIASNIWNENISRLPARGDGLTIIHSVLTGRFHDLAQRLSHDTALAAEWRSMVQVDPRDKAALAQLLLAHALRSNPGGLVLFQTAKPENIRTTVKALTERSVNSSQIDNLDRLVKSGGLPLPEDGIYRDYLRVS
jgi:D-threo-aldose 1-dehydrogenase